MFSLFLLAQSRHAMQCGFLKEPSGEESMMSVAWCDEDWIACNVITAIGSQPSDHY